MNNNEELVAEVIEAMRKAGKAGYLDTGNKAWDMLCDLALEGLRNTEVQRPAKCEVWMGSSWQCSEPYGHTGKHCFNGTYLPRHESDKPGIHGFDSFARSHDTHVSARETIAVEPWVLDVLICVAQGQRNNRALSATALAALDNAEKLMANPERLSSLEPSEVEPDERSERVGEKSGSSGEAGRRDAVRTGGAECSTRTTNSASRREGKSQEELTQGDGTMLDETLSSELEPAFVTEHHRKAVKRHVEYLVWKYADKEFRSDTSNEIANVINDAINLARGVKEQLSATVVSDGFWGGTCPTCGIRSP